MMDSDKCQELISELSLILDGAVSEEFCDEIKSYLGDCQDCQIVINTLKKTVLLYRQLPQPTISGDTRKRLYQSLKLQEFLD
jgi:hypothetical protein